MLPDSTNDATNERAQDGLPVASIQLGDGLAVAECVHADGQTVYWLLLPGGEGGRWNPGDAPHELTGPLPREWRRRVGITCDAATRTTGRPCTNFVAQPGDRCHAHTGARS